MTVTMSVRLSADEFQQFMDLCRKHNVSRQEMLRAMVVDALAEESPDGLRSKQSKGRQDGRETGEGCRPAA
jgi:hypothetical protein